MTSARGLPPLLLVALTWVGDARAFDGVAWQFDAIHVSSARPLPNGEIVIPDKGTGEILWITPRIPVGGSVTLAFGSFGQGDTVRPDGFGGLVIANTPGQTVLQLSPALIQGWTFGKVTAACADDRLNEPSDIVALPSGDFLIADQKNNRVIQADIFFNKKWQYGDSVCVAGSGANELSAPYGIEVYSNGVLITDTGNHAVIRVTPNLPTGGTVVWTYGTRGTGGSGPGQLNFPIRATPLANGNVLIADSQNHRVIEVTPTLPAGGTVVWQYGVTGVAGTEIGYLNQPYDAQRMSNGDTLIADSGNNRVVEVSPLRWNVVSPPLVALVPGECRGPISLRLQDAYGGAASAPQPGLLALGAPAITFYSDSACTQSVTSLAISPGTTQLGVYVTATAAGVLTLTTSSAGYLPTSTLLRAAQPAKIVFASSPLTLVPGICGRIPLVLSLHDSADLPVVPTWPLSLRLESSPGGLRFYTSPDCQGEEANPIWSVGAASLKFYVKGPGPTASVSVSAPGFPGAQQPVAFASLGCSLGGVSAPSPAGAFSLTLLALAARSLRKGRCRHARGQPRGG